MTGMRVKVGCIQNHDEAVMAMRYGASALGLTRAASGNRQLPRAITHHLGINEVV